MKRLSSPLLANSHVHLTNENSVLCTAVGHKITIDNFDFHKDVSSIIQAVEPLFEGGAEG